jgi:hypothetical protein
MLQGRYSRNAKDGATPQAPEPRSGKKSDPGSDRQKCKAGDTAPRQEGQNETPAIWDPGASEDRHKPTSATSRRRRRKLNGAPGQSPPQAARAHIRRSMQILHKTKQGGHLQRLQGNGSRLRNMQGNRLVHEVPLQGRNQHAQLRKSLRSRITGGPQSFEQLQLGRAEQVEKRKMKPPQDRITERPR